LSINLFVANLPWSVNDDALKSTFAEYGEVDSAKVITDRQTGKSRGFGFVEMKNESEAKEAINALHDSVMNGRNIIVKEARPKS